ncbi:MAG: hypothetical protein R3F03_02390 [Opitutaceae bacterium]
MAILTTMRRPHGLWLIGFACVARLFAVEDANDAPVWSAATRLDFKSARRELEQLPMAASDHDQRLQRALLQIVTPPQTEARLDEAAAALSELANDPSAGEIAAIAAYQFARLAHTRGGAHDAELIENYRAVWTRFPGSPQAERAFVFASIIRQYRADESADEKRAGLLQWDEEAVRRLHSDAGRRSYHLAASMAWARLLRDDERACAHLKIVHALGLASQYTFSDVVFRLGEYHRLSGERTEALRYFKEFVERYPVDRRTDLARRLIQQLSAHEDA